MVADGWQACGSALAHLRSIVHALRGWPTPMGVTFNPSAGKLFDDDGEPLYVQGAAKGQRRYRYYVSRSLVRGEGDDSQRGWRLPAIETEQAIASAARSRR